MPPLHCTDLDLRSGEQDRVLRCFEWASFFRQLKVRTSRKKLRGNLQDGHVAADLSRLQRKWEVLPVRSASGIVEKVWPSQYMEEDSDDETSTNFWRLHGRLLCHKARIFDEGSVRDGCGESGICRNVALRPCSLNELSPTSSTPSNRLARWQTSGFWSWLSSGKQLQGLRSFELLAD